MRYTHAFAGIAALFLAACTHIGNKADSTQTTYTSMEQTSSEWSPLFDGKTTKGWRTYGQDTIGQAWKVQDGALFLDASQKDNWQVNGGGDIVTEEEYSDFHLKLDWKIAENGNSGIIFYVHEDPEKYKYAWHTGLEMQVLHNEGHPDGKIHTHRAGDLYDLVAASPESARPVGEWNQAEIVARGGKLDFFLNGHNVVSTTLWDDTWKVMVAGSKFKDMPSFGTYRKGRIALQDHGDNVWFRNIMIKRLDQTEPGT
jgi:hypothetical protein